MPNSFGQVITEARKLAKLSQKDLAAQILKEGDESISAQYLNDIEHDRRNPPSEEMINQFAGVLGIPRELLYYYARKLPQDMTDDRANKDRIVAAYTAFRRVIKG